MERVRPYISKTEAARRHVEDIRRNKFSIGAKVPNPLMKDLHNAVAGLSSELYTKDIHFLKELIQNAEDNEYLEAVGPKLEFVMTTKDITGVGAQATLLVFNNELGFSKANIDALCSIGQSTKKGKRRQGYIGEKGIGFKSVFLVSAQPFIFSNGYRICFKEFPDGDCGIGYIVPEWVTTRPSIQDLQSVYKSSIVLPTTTIVLPLKAEKAETVKKELSQIQPEVLLFLQKIKQLAVWEDGILSSRNSLSAVSISSETSLVPARGQVADSRLLHISVQEKHDNSTSKTRCSYYIHRQAFPVKPACIVEQRKDVKQWMISLAFPLGERLKRGTSSVGIFAFLPTSMVTNFPFMIQSDFILASSREAILVDNKWNLGILEQVPSTFVGALITCIKSAEIIKLLPVHCALNLLPAKESPFEELNKVRECIKFMVQSECIVLYESFLDEPKVFCRPTDVLRILPKFRNILTRIKEDKIPLNAVSSQRKFVLHNLLDNKMYDELLNFLGVPSAHCSYDWYGKCIKTCNLLCRASPDVYMDLLSFLAEYWEYMPLKSVDCLPLLKYIIWNGDVLSCSVAQIKQESLKIHLVWSSEEHAWLSKWNLELGCPNDLFFCPDFMATALLKDEKHNFLKRWLTSALGVVITDAFSYALEVVGFIRRTKDPDVAILFAHFVYHSFMKKYLGSHNISKVLLAMPIVDKSGYVSLCSRSLVPAYMGTWVKLFGLANPFSVGYETSNKKSIEQHEVLHHANGGDNSSYCGKYAELGDSYLEAAEFAGLITPEKELFNFLVMHVKAIDLPHILPPDDALQVASTLLTSEQSLLLLDWIKKLRSQQCQINGWPKKYEIPRRFIESIRSGKWMKTCSGISSPLHCYLYGGNENAVLLELGKALNVLSAIDEVYFSHAVRSFMDELVFIGVKIGSENMFQLITDHLKPLLSSKMSSKLAVLILGFIRYSRENNKLDGNMKKSLQEGKWLKTLRGYASPVGSVLLTSAEEKAVAQISNLKIVCRPKYGVKLASFLDELKFLGVTVDLEEVYKLIPKHLRFPDNLSSLTKDSVLLLLKCMQFTGADAFESTRHVFSQCWMKTTSGFRCPSESVLFDPMWDHLLKVVSLPIIDESYYGSRIRSYKEELEAIAVIVNLDSASKLVVDKLKLLIASSGLIGTKVISLLNFLKCAKNEMPCLVSAIVSCLLEEMWLKTNNGYSYTSHAILFNCEWATVSQLVNLPVIDETFYGDEIYNFKEELKMLGVVVNFNNGIPIIVRGLKLPEDPSLVTVDMFLSLLHCVASLKSDNSSDQSLLEDLLKKLRAARWLKTHLGYRLPQEALLYDLDWEGHLKLLDGPFLDQSFYRNLDCVEMDALRMIGVKTGPQEVCNWFFQNFTSLVQTCQVKRIYKFMYKYHWTPNSEDNVTCQLWVPDDHVDVCGMWLDTVTYQWRIISDHHIKDGGRWVDNHDCVISDDCNLFAHRLHVLDKLYEMELLNFLSSAFSVAWCPTLDKYMDLWKFWLESNHQVTSVELKSFWGYILRNWDDSTLEILERNINAFPAVDVSGGIQLVDRGEVFIADDLQLKKSFKESSKRPLFIWFPQDDLNFQNRLSEIYCCLGVQKLSESVECLVNGDFHQMDPEDNIIGKLLVKIVMGFLASRINMPLGARLRKAKSLLDLPIFGTDKPLEVTYSLQVPSSGPEVHVGIYKKVFWDRNSKRLLIHTPSWSGGQKDIQLVTDYARAISEVVLSNCSGHVDLCHIIKLGFAFGFQENEIDELLMIENLAVSSEDTDFIDHVFPPIKNLIASVMDFASFVWMMFGAVFGLLKIHADS
ncbi:uncharacterized protein LOC113780715 [Coffea eugenioides]|uniref:uncharacterized protein LOC113780715 n=1 Tax=Coffea eugenioides TaxID=49369 RepID=UPI000F607EC1|nr:uncharacterized protein LOC113780715 [Coffea eugenioides]